MYKYFSEEYIHEMNRITLLKRGKEHKFEVIYPYDIRFTMHIIEEEFGEDIYKKALAYCIFLFVLHPFKDGNHATSMFCAEKFLTDNGFITDLNEEEQTRLREWRIEYEIENNMGSYCCYIAGIENDVERREKIIEIMDSEYGKIIEEWLKKNYRPS